MKIQGNDGNLCSSCQKTRGEVIALSFISCVMLEKPPSLIDIVVLACTCVCVCVGGYEEGSLGFKSSCK